MNILDYKNVVSGQYASIYDSASCQIIVSGKILQVKYCIGSNTLNENKTNHVLIQSPYITFDYKHFFHFNSRRYQIIENLQCISIKNQLPQSYIVDMWTPDRRKFKAESDFENIDVFIEFTVKELDKEIEPIVRTLNRIGFKTTASCCGHYSIFPHVVLCIRCIQEQKLLDYIVNDINTVESKDILSLSINCDEFKFYNSNNSQNEKLEKLEILDKSSEMPSTLKTIAKQLEKYVDILS